MKEVTKSTERFQELDALRGIAAIMVLFFHSQMYDKNIFPNLKFGITGVDLFFIISGFVIFMSLNKITKSRDFIINRVSRLYPTFWAAVTFTFVLKSVYAYFNSTNYFSSNLVNYFVNLTMFQYYLKVPDLDGPYWTMIIEMVFYICILLLFHFKKINYLNIIGICLSILAFILAYFWGGNSIVMRIFLFFPLLQYVPLFLSGTIFYKIYTTKKNLLSYYSILLLCLIIEIQLFHNTFRYSAFISHQSYTIMLCIYYALFTLFVNNKLKFIVNKVTLFLGKISFAFYLIHQYLVVDVIIPIMIVKYHIPIWNITLFISLPISLLIATAITYFIEIPLSRKMKMMLRSRFSA